MVVKLRLVLSISIFFLSFYGAAQSPYWIKSGSYSQNTQQQVVPLEVKNAQIFTLDSRVFGDQLQATMASKGKKTLAFPNAAGELTSFQIEEASVFSPALAQKYPAIKSYIGHSLDASGDRIRFSVSHKGLQSMIIHGNGQPATFMQKTSRANNEYMVYKREDTYRMNTDFICDTQSVTGPEKRISSQKLVDGQELRKYRVAISATGEYTAYHGGTVADALAGINATLTRVNEVFERDLGVRLELVAETEQVIYLNKDTDPYGVNLNSEVQHTLTTVVGPENYDVGHLFHKDFNGGNAGFIASACIDSRKGSAYSSGSMPEGDMFDLDFVAHEFGHQFGANHTWSYESEGTLVQAEPGSGTTIMGYAGISGKNNVALKGDDYFHYYSILQILDYIETANCGEVIPITNNPPQITPSGDYTIPKSTAFALTAHAVDIDSTDILTYNWEQINDGIVTYSSFGPTNLSGANFRSIKPSVQPTRYFPRLSSIVNGNLTQTNPTNNSTWETVSDVERDLSFALTVRDNAPGGGQVDADLVTVKVTDQAGPFKITSQAANETYLAGTRQEVTWDVANTNQFPVNTQMVDIYFSANGGISFPILLAEGAPNDGQHDIIIPSTATNLARIMVQAHDNIFLAVNASNFNIATSEIVLDFPKLQYEVCQGDNLTTSFTYKTFGGFSEEATFSATGIPAGLTVDFSPTSTAVNDTLVNLSFSNTNAVTPGNYPINILATTPSITKTIAIDLRVLDTNNTDVVLQSPANGATNTNVATVLEWAPNPSHTSYELEIAEDPSFTNIIRADSTLFTTYLTDNLSEGNTYFWRVKPKNSCGEGTFGPAFSFSTIDLDCNTKTANGLPMAISTTGTSTITASIDIINDLPIADMNVTIDLKHTFLADLEIDLISPSGTRVTLVSNSCGASENINATFDDDANSFICGTNPAIQGTVKPLGSLSAFNGESSFGQWTLEVRDVAPSDGGFLNTFSIDFCVEGTLRIDDDNDGVFDDGDDLCLGTPPGTLVDLNGCPVYLFPADNFEIAINSASCRGKSDGSIDLHANKTLNYQGTITGGSINTTFNFTESYTIQNLAAGTYGICIEGTEGGKTYEPYCFETVISEPHPLTVNANLTADGKQVIITMEGAEEYHIELNGALTTTTSPALVLNLSKGINHLKVQSKIACQGVFEKQFLLLDKPQAYPNPFDEIVSIRLDQTVEELSVATYTLAGKFIKEKTYRPTGHSLNLDFSGLPSGSYLLRLKGSVTNTTIHVIKK